MDAGRWVGKRAERAMLTSSVLSSVYRAVRETRRLQRRALPLPLVFRVQGYSMAPTLQPGDWLWVNTNTTVPPRPEELVVIRHPKANPRMLVKRVRSCGQSTFSVGSDDPTEGHDSRFFGPLTKSHFVGRVRFYWRPRRDFVGRPDSPGAPVGTNSNRASKRAAPFV